MGLQRLLPCRPTLAPPRPPPTCRRLPPRPPTPPARRAPPGIDDPYAAWHEVLWALNVSDGLAPRAFRARIDWSPGAHAALSAAVKFAGAAGRDKVTSIDIVLSLAAAGVLGHLFPDLDMSLPAVRRAAAQVAGEKYVLPGDKGATVSAPGDMFL